MNIPYKKAFIYALTFLTYIYSGYGADVLTNLRDAVLAAENVIGGVFQNVATVAEKFKNLQDVFSAAVEEDCLFKCVGTGMTPKPNRHHVPKADGCGSLGLQIKTEYLPIADMTKCCDSHDICYDTCNNNKELCDVEFRKCLYKYCDTQQKNVGETMVKACKGAAKMLFTGTLTLGCKSYIDAQTQACYCAPTYGNKQKEYRKKNKYTTGDGDL